MSFQTENCCACLHAHLSSVVAVHGLEENLIEAWTDPETKILWLRDLLPQDVKYARILTFGYNAHATSFYGNGSADRIQQHAQTLIADLQADRSLEGCSARPIVFLCHGLGGILVKKAIAYSSTRTSKNVEHLYSIFVSTYAIFFFGTPHHGADKSNWLATSNSRLLLAKARSKKESQLLSVIGKDCETLENITEQFTHLMKQFHIFFLWEELETDMAGRKGYIVEESSAAPIIDQTERAGIHANHAQMIRFSNTKCSSYRTVIEALRRYCHSAPSVIARRWQYTIQSLALARSGEASELAGTAFDVHNESRPYQYQRKASERPRNKHFQIPQAVSSIFTGREDVSRAVEEAFWAPAEDDGTLQQRRYIIHGIGGSGKTQFCSKFAQDHRERCVQVPLQSLPRCTDIAVRFWGVFWIDATSVDTAKQSLSAIGKLGGMEATKSAGKHWLSNAEEPWLLIINNADDPNLDIQNLFPEGERGYVLLTTRNPDFRIHGTVGSKEFRGLGERDAIHLLLRAADSPRPWSQLVEELSRKIADALGYLALALIQAGALILQRICDMHDYLDFHKKYRQTICERQRSPASITDVEFAIYATWEHSLDSLRSRHSEAGTDAVQMLSVIAFFHFEHIRVDIFTRALANRTKTFLKYPKSSVTDRLIGLIRSRLQPPPVLPEFLRQNSSKADLYRIRRAIHQLSSFSLVSYDGKDDTFSLHPVVHSWARDRLHERERRTWAQIAVNVLSESILLPPDDAGESHETYRRDILIHLDICLRTNPVKIMEFNASFGGIKFPLAFTVHYARLFVFQDQVLTAAKLGYVYLQCGLFPKAAELLCSVKDSLIASRGYNHEETMRATMALAGTYWMLGRLEEAIELQRRVIDARKLTNGAKHKETLSAMDQLGRSYWLNGQFKEALGLQMQTVEWMREILGPEHDLTLTAMDNLGVTYGSWQRYHESKDIHSRVYTARKQRQGPHHVDTLMTMNNMALALKELGVLSEAKKLLVEVSSQRAIKLGKEHPWTLWATCNLAKVNTDLNQLQEAETMLVSGIAAGKRSLSDDHVGVLVGVGELARVYARQGRLQEAASVTEDLVSRLERSRGEGHPDTVYTLHKLARVYEMQGRFDKAIEACELAKVRSRFRLPEEHPLVGQIGQQLISLTTHSPEDEGEASIPKTDRLGLYDRSDVVQSPKAETARAAQPLQLRKTF